MTSRNSNAMLEDLTRRPSPPASGTTTRRRRPSCASARSRAEARAREEARARDRRRGGVPRARRRRERRGAIADADAQAGALDKRLRKAELERMLSGPADHANAIVSIHPGAGGIDAKDWAAMLLRMYLRWCERRGYKTEIIDFQEGDEAGIDGVVVHRRRRLRVRLPAQRDRRAPPRAHEPVRRRTHAPDRVRRGRGHARHRGRDRHRR